MTTKLGGLDRFSNRVPAKYLARPSSANEIDLTQRDLHHSRSIKTVEDWAQVLSEDVCHDFHYDVVMGRGKAET